MKPNATTVVKQTSQRRGLRNWTIAVVLLTLLTMAGAVRAQSLTYSNAIINLKPVSYWPMHEIGTPAVGDTETNYGSLGALGTGYYADWAVSNGAPDSHSILHGIPGPLANGADTGVYLLQPGYVSGNFGTNSYLVVPHTSPLTTLQPPFTLEAWMSASNYNFGDVFSQCGTKLNGGNDNNAYGIRFSWSSGMQTYGSVGQGITASVELPTNTSTAFYWNYVVLTCDSNNNWIMYGNNTVIGSHAPGVFTNDTWDPLTIGAGMQNVNGVTRETAMGLCEVAVYTNALSVTTISNHWAVATNLSSGPSDYYNAVVAGNPLLYYRMNSPYYLGFPATNTWPVLNNFGSVATNGFYMPGVTPGSVAGPNGSGFFYAGLSSTNAMPGNGVSAFADLGPNPALNPTGNAPFSVTACFQGNPADSRLQSIAGHSDSSWHLRLDTTGKLRFGTGVETSDLISSKVYNDGNWHIAVCVYDGKTNYIYGDGILDTFATNTAPGGTIGFNSDVLLGADPEWIATNTGAGMQFAGNVCEVAFFTNALTAAQVQSLYNEVGVPVQIKQQPISAVLNQGVAFTNTVAVSGSQPFSYQWFTNGVAISGATNTSLIYNPVVGANASTNYYVVITNESSAVTSSVVSLSVAVYPQFLGAFPITYTNVLNTNYMMVYVGANPAFSVSADGAIPLSYQWFTNGAAAGFATNTSYTATNVQSAGINVYCIITNTYGSATSVVWNATALPDPTNSVGGPATYPQQVLALNPIAYWRMNDANLDGQDNGNGDNGYLCHDYAGGNNGIYTNAYYFGQDSPSYNPVGDPSDSSVSFSGNNSDVNSILAPDMGTPNGVNAEFTVEAWVDPLATMGSGTPTIVAKGGYFQEEFTLDAGAGTNSLRFEVRNAAGTAYNANSTVSMQNGTYVNQWFHLVGVCDEVNGLVSFYINGQLAATAAIPTASGITNSSTTPLTIGSRSSTDSQVNNNEPWAGAINDIAVFNYPLSALQVENEYVAGGGTNAPYFNPKPSANVTNVASSTLTIPVTALGTPPMGYWWTNMTTGAGIASGTVNNNTSGDVTLSYANVPLSWNNDQLQLTVTNATGATNALFTLNITAPIPTIPTNIVVSVANQTLSLSWPANYTGWTLQAQTNSVSVGIRTNWVNVSGSSGVHQIAIPINLTNGTVFYRLIYTP